MGGIWQGAPHKSKSTRASLGLCKTTFPLLLHSGSPRASGQSEVRLDQGHTDTGCLQRFLWWTESIYLRFGSGSSFSYHISLENLISLKVCVSNCVSGQVTSGMQPGTCKQLMKSNRVHTFGGISCLRVCLSYFPHCSLPPGYGLGLFSITTVSASGKHRCLQSLEIQIHLLDHIQEEGDLGVSRHVMGEGWLSGHEPRGTH